MTEENNTNGTEHIVSKYDEERDLQGNTKLHKLVQLAIENDFATPVQPNEKGNSLSYADLILLEISKGANIYAENNNKESPLELMKNAFENGKARWNKWRQTPYAGKYSIGLQESSNLEGNKDLQDLKRECTRLQEFIKIVMLKQTLLRYVARHQSGNENMCSKTR